MSAEQKLSLAEKVKAAAAKGAAEGAKAAEQAAPKAPTYRYKGNHVRRLVLRNGSIVLPDAEGVFTATTQEEYDMLEHMAASTSCSLEKIL